MNKLRRCVPCEQKNKNKGYGRIVESFSEFVVRMDDKPYPLNESKQRAKSNFLDRGLIDQQTFNFLLDGDPTPTKKYIERMCKFFTQGEDINEIVEVVNEIHSLANRNIVKFDISSIQTLQSLRDLISSKGSYVTRNEKRKKAQEGAEVVYETDDVLVLKIVSEEASCVYGKGTKWCISGGAVNQWGEYWDKFKSSFYFVIDDTKEESDPLYKLAVLIENDENIIVFDALDKEDAVPFSYITNTLRIPASVFKQVQVTTDDIDLDVIVNGTYTQRSNGIIDVEGDVDLTNKKLKTIPYQFGRVSGNFFVYSNRLTTLKGSPEFVGGKFNCSYNKLTSLQFAPREVGDGFDCCRNLLVDMVGAPRMIPGDFDIYINMLTSLEGSPVEVEGGYYVSHQHSGMKFTEEEVRGVCEIGGDVEV